MKLSVKEFINDFCRTIAEIIYIEEQEENQWQELKEKLGIIDGV